MNILLLIIVCITSPLLLAREIRTPLLRDNPGYRLMPLPLSDAKPWDARTWIEPFGKIATHAFCKTNNCSSLCTNNNNQCPLSTILFGQSNFTGAEIFSPTSIAQSRIIYNGDGTNRAISCSPTLETSVLKPCLKFVDRGVMFALQAVRRIKDCWSAGVRASVPYRSFKIANRGCSNPIFGGAILTDDLISKTETINGVTVKSYAYRLDTLSKLPIGCTYPQNQFPLVDYFNTLHLNNDITISNENVTGNSALSVNARNPITLLQPVGHRPTGQFAMPLALAQTLPALPSNGQTNDYRTRFIDGTNYQTLGQDNQTQAQLWVVPTVDSTDLVPAALVIRDNVDLLLETAYLSTEQMLEEQCCNDLNTYNAKAIGDTQTEYFVRWQPDKYFYIEALFGLLFPTGKRIHNPQQVLAWPTGNNGHFEYRVGAHIGIQPNDYIMLNAQSYYTYASPHTEQVIAPFCGAKVKNIGGPVIPARIKWSYYLGRYDIALLQPCTQGTLGVNVGYELYIKGKDKIQFTQCCARDCLGNNAILDRSILAQRTHVVSQKILTTLFYDTSDHKMNKLCHWSFFVGYSSVVAGHNIANEHGPYGGIMVIY